MESVLERLSPEMQREYEALVGPIARRPVEIPEGPESFRSFARRQGEYVKVTRGVGMRTGEPDEAYWFLSGAVSDGWLNHQEPPEELWSRIALQRRYLTERIRQEVECFNTAKSEYLQQAAMRQKYGNVPGPPPDAVDQLTRGKAKIDGYRQKLERLPQKPKSEQEVAKERMREEAAMEEQRTIDAIRRISV